jgi:hypothetical protein
MIRFIIALAAILASFTAIPAASSRGAITLSLGPYDWQVVGASTAAEAITKASCQPHASAYIVAPADGIARFNLFTFTPPNVQSVSAVRLSLCVAAAPTTGEAGGSRYVFLADPNAEYFFQFAQIDSGEVLFREKNAVLTLDPRTGLPWTVAGAGSLLSDGFLLFGSLVPVGRETGIAVSRFAVEVLP